MVAFKITSKSPSPFLKRGAIESFVDKEISSALNDIGKIYVNTVKSRLRGRIPGDKGLQKNTGALAKTLKFKVSKGQKGTQTLTATIGKGLPYGAIHEFGGTIKAKNADFLTIPLKAIKGQDKRPIITARDAFRSGASVVELPDGRLFVVGRFRGKKQFLFKLQKEVEIPPRLQMRDILKGKVTRFRERMQTRLDKLESRIAFELDKS